MQITVEIALWGQVSLHPFCPPLSLPTTHTYTPPPPAAQSAEQALHTVGESREPLVQKHLAGGILAEGCSPGK